MGDRSEKKNGLERPVGEPQMPVLRFGLRQFFWWVTGICVLLAGLVALPWGMGLAAVLLAVSVVALHVLSTAIGTRLRDHANEMRAWEAGQVGSEWAEQIGAGSLSAVPLRLEPQQRSPLHGHDQPLRRMRVCLTVGAALGGLLGVLVLSLAIGNRATVAGILVGAASMAVVGGWLAFVGASAWSIFRQGWRDAVKERPKSSDDLGAR
jgi:hypothetical protein